MDPPLGGFYSLRMQCHSFGTLTVAARYPYNEVRRPGFLMVPRSRILLHEIVAAYIETGEPVASGSIARRRGDSLSAASVRNIMADLDEEGYLHQPHTSAGRIPTEKAFRSYVQSLTLRRMATFELERLRAEFGRLETVEQRVEYTSRMLMDMTRGFGIAAAIRQISPALEHIELVSLQDRR